MMGPSTAVQGMIRPGALSARRKANGNFWAETPVSREPSPDEARVSALRARPGGLPLRSSAPVALGGMRLLAASAATIGLH